MVCGGVGRCGGDVCGCGCVWLLNDSDFHFRLEFGFRSLPAGGDVMAYSTLTKRIFL